MSDYSKSYNGAAKDAAESTIVGVDFDTEFSAIETAIASKADVAGATLTGATLTQPALTLTQSATPTPTAEGVVEWDTDGNQIAVGDGSGTKVFSDDSVVLARANHTGTITNAAINKTIGSEGTQLIAASGSWVPTEGFYNIASSSGTGSAITELFVSAAWHGAGAAPNGLIWFDGTNMRITEAVGSNSVTVAWQKMT